MKALYEQENKYNIYDNSQKSFRTYEYLINICY